jgi:hypothetical protein
MLGGLLRGRSYEYHTKLARSFLVDLAALALSCKENETAH